MDNFNTINTKKGSNIENIKESDLNARKYTDAPTFKALELIMGTGIGNKYLHDYKRYNVVDVRSKEKLQFDANKGYNKDSISYNLFDLFMTTSARVYKEYSYEIIANNSREMNKVRIPVYIDDSENFNPNNDMRDYIQLINGLDIEISYLDKKKPVYISDMTMDSTLLFDEQSDIKGAKKYYNRYDTEATAGNPYAHKFIYNGYNRFFASNNIENMASWSTGAQRFGIEMTNYEYNTNTSYMGLRSKFSRHRNSIGNHQYRTKVTFLNTDNKALMLVEELNRLRYLKAGSNGKYNTNEIWDVKRKINLITHQDMVWGINKSMIAPNLYDMPRGGILTSWTNDIANSKYAMCFTPNYPTVYIGFEEEYYTQIFNHTKGLKKIGYITVTFFTFRELGLFPSNDTLDNLYKVKRTCDDFSENGRFNIKIKIPKRNTNLIYKGQLSKGSEIFLIPGHLEYEESKFISSELGISNQDELYNVRNIRHIDNLSICSDSKNGLENKDLIINTCGIRDKGTQDELDVAWLLKIKNMQNMSYLDDASIRTPSNWRTLPDIQFAGTVLGNYGGWIFPPFRFSNIYAWYTQDTQIYNDRYTYDKMYTYLNLISSYNKYTVNSGAYYLSARDYPISLGPILNKQLVHF
nr:MAG TPA: hypothetical protein [Caudoviricetes sp.]